MSDREDLRPAREDDVPTMETPLGTASLWRQYLRDPELLKPALDAVALKPERWGDYSGVAVTMARLSFPDMPVSFTSRSPHVAYVRLVGGGADWFLTTVRGADGLWRVVDLTPHVRPPAEDVSG